MWFFMLNEYNMIVETNWIFELNKNEMSKING